MMIDYKLANILLQVDPFMGEHETVFYRTDAQPSFIATENTLTFSGTLDFTTYFNALSMAKWRQYTSISSLFLHLELSGNGCELVPVCLDAAGTSTEGTTHALNIPNTTSSSTITFKSFDIEISLTDALLWGFILKSQGTTSIRNAYYFTRINESFIRKTRMALCTTTFRNEQYILPNIESVRKNVLGSSDSIADNFHLFVIDNGKTLDAAALTHNGVTVVPNRNSGGSGGFARGMIEALTANEAYTHVLLMDDDVRVFPESFKRTFNLLSLTNDKYKNANISGAMLMLETPNVQFEDVSFVREDGAYQRVKTDLSVDKVADLVKNEATSVEVDNAYAAWWYCCIPLETVRSKGLPLPFFIRCDDVEYGLRTRPLYMTLNGICVWHAGFDGRFRASVDCYQYIRNYLVMTAVDNTGSDKLFLMRMARNLRIYLRLMSYDTADLLLDGLEDYLKGPKFLESCDGELTMKTKGAKNERLLLLKDLDPSITKDLVIDYDALGEKRPVGKFLKLWRSLPYDRHFLPDALLSSKPATVYYSGSTTPGSKIMAKKTLVALDLQGTHGIVRTMDKARWKQIRNRWKILRRQYNENAESLKAQYQEAAPYLTSLPFWENYLDIR